MANSQPKPAFEPYIKYGNLIFISGQLPMENGKIEDLYKGTLGDNISIDNAQKALKICTHNLLDQAKKANNGTLENLKCLKITVFVSSNKDFNTQPVVANAASEEIKAILGEANGSHSRSAIGVSSLPFGASVEVEAIFGII